jgi:hypothetical protein
VLKVNKRQNNSGNIRKIASLSQFLLRRYFASGFWTKMLENSGFGSVKVKNK